MNTVTSMGKVLMVIGASSDLGMGTIRHLHINYEKIVGLYYHMNDELSELQTELADKLVLIQANLLNEEEVQSFINEVKDRGLLPDHILHFPAPVCNNQKFHKIEWKVFQDELDITLKSLVIILQAFIPSMAKKHYGKIVVMLSFVITNISPAYCSNYVVSKYAMYGLVRALSTEYASKGITVNGVSPSWIETKYINNQPDFLISQNAMNSPIGRNLTVDDVVPTISYLLSTGADCVNGQNISITCGR